MINCDYCQHETKFVSSKVVYGVDYGMIYLCRPCGAWVGVHVGTVKPKGRLANAKLRKLRVKAHKAFDPIWMNGKKKRGTAYKRLSEWLEIDYEDCHIGLFDEAMCRKVVEVCQDYEL